LKKDYTDYSYQDITNVVLDKGIMRSTIKLTIKREGELLKLGKLPNSLAEKAYGIIRENLSRFQAPFSTGYANAPPFQQVGAPAEVPSTPIGGQKPSEEKKKN
jgi:hypothetical protein